MAETAPAPDPSSQLDVSSDASRLAELALREDGPRDLTGELTGVAGRTAARVRCRERAVAAGSAYGSAVAERAGCRVAWHAADGVHVGAGEVVATVTGGVASVLKAERPLLNMLQRAYGIATATHRYVYAVAGTHCRILHTRKTAPGLRLFDVAAVLAGGGGLHRLGLDRVLMLKDNHWVALGGSAERLEAVVAEARRRGVEAVQIEVERVDQVEAACRAGADRLLVDNQPPDAFRTLGAHARALRPDVELEATGGITLENAAAYARAGADFLSIGALTHSVQAVDLSLEFSA